MAELKTRPTTASVSAFLNSISDEQVRKDCKTIAKMMQKATNAKPRMWGPSIVGFGTYHYKYASGREADWPLASFSPRKQNITVYIMAGFDKYDALMAKLGPHSCAKSCLYLKRLADVDVKTLDVLINESVKHMRKKYPSRRP